MHLPFLILGIAGVFLLGICGTVCFDTSGKQVCLFSVLMLRDKESFLKENMISIYTLIDSFSGTWYMIFLPSLLVIPFVINLTEERNRGNLVFMMIREKPLNYCLSKLLALMIYGGAVCGGSFLAFLALVLPLKKYCVIFPEMEEVVLSEKAAGGLFSYVLITLMINILLGMFSVLPGYLTGIFFRDRHMLICIPVLIRYVQKQALSIILFKASGLSDYSFYEKARKFDLENLNYEPGSGGWFFTLALMLASCVLLPALFVFVLKKRKQRGLYG